MARDRADRPADAGAAAPSLQWRARRRMSKGQKKQKTTGKLGWRSKKANHGRKPGMGRGKRN